MISTIFTLGWLVGVVFFTAWLCDKPGWVGRHFIVRWATAFAACIVWPFWMPFWIAHNLVQWMKGKNGLAAGKMALKRDFG
jgi:UDP-N-acetylmuramyl pentapeptide phosphotransferase/UDP-N-acetylglucosamine-1-phosphate transferase